MQAILSLTSWQRECDYWVKMTFYCFSRNCIKVIFIVNGTEVSQSYLLKVRCKQFFPQLLTVVTTVLTEFSSWVDFYSNIMFFKSWDCDRYSSEGYISCTLTTTEKYWLKRKCKSRYSNQSKNTVLLPRIVLIISVFTIIRPTPWLQWPIFLRNGR